MSEVRLGKGMSVDQALKKLKKKLDREGTLQQVRDRRYYVPPSEKKKKQKSAAKWAAKKQAEENELWR
tara:strand:+ start:5069 stop:5272 length:204 start_codon:yes stop_codon:yes gene_type:complete